MADEAVVVKEYLEKDSLSDEELKRLYKLVYGSEKSRKAVSSMLKEMEEDASFKRSAPKAYKLALAMWFADRDSEAVELLGKNLKSRQSYVTYLDWCITSQKYQEAFDKSEEALKEYARDTDLLLLQAHAAARLEKIKEAESALKTVEKALKPLDLDKVDEEKAKTGKKESKKSGKQEGESEEDEEPEEPQRYPGHGAMYFIKGLVQEAQGNWEQSVEFYDLAIKADPENIHAHFRKAFQLDLRGLDSEAIQTYEEARRLRPLRASVVFNLGVLYEDMGKNKKAIQCYRTILEHNPNHFRARLFLEDAEASRNMVYDEEEEKEQDKMLQVLNTPITDFELSVRSRNCLAKMNIKTLGDLSRKSEMELLSYKNFGETSLAEIKALLSTKGLALGMSTEDFFAGEDDDEQAEEAAAEIGGLEHMEATEEESDILDTPLVDIPFTVRCQRAFEKLGLKTLGELASTPISEFKALRNFGETSLQELTDKLAEYGIALPEE